MTSTETELFIICQAILDFVIIYEIYKTKK